MPALYIALTLAIPAAHAQETVYVLADEWTAAFNAYDAEKLAALYTDDAQLMMNGAPTITGRDAIRAFWAADFREDSPLTLLTITHSINGVDMTLVHGNYEVVNRDNGDIISRGRFAHIWVKAETGGWALDRDLWAEPFEPFEE